MHNSCSIIVVFIIHTQGASVIKILFVHNVAGVKGQRTPEHYVKQKNFIFYYFHYHFTQSTLAGRMSFHFIQNNMVLVQEWKQ